MHLGPGMSPHLNIRLLGSGVVQVELAMFAGRTLAAIAKRAALRRDRSDTTPIDVRNTAYFVSPF